MSRSVGIDLGTTFSCVAYLDGRTPRVIPNWQNSATTPSVVSFQETGGEGQSEVLVGQDALRQALLQPEKTISEVKRLIGHKYSDPLIEQTRKRLTYELVEAENGDAWVRVGPKSRSPQEISGHILTYLKSCAESYLDEEVTEAVITVPAHFNDHQRQATKDAAEIAGLKVLRIINEPTAAALAYGLDRSSEALTAVYDLGGGTFDFTVLEVKDGVFNVLATNGNTFLGGVDFNQRILNWLRDAVSQELGHDLGQDRVNMQRIVEVVEKAKRELSSILETPIRLPFIGGDEGGAQHVEKVLTRNQLEELTRDLIEQTFVHVDEALSSAKTKAGDIEEIILIGGQTRMPLIRSMVSDHFGKQPVEGINPDETVAKGAAIQGSLLKGESPDLMLLLDVTPLSLGIEVEDDQFVKIIEKNTTVPTKKTMAFTTVEDNQQSVKIHVLQGEHPLASKNVSLGNFNLIGIAAAPAGIPQIDVSFEIDSDGLVKVSARDIISGKAQAIQIQPAAGLPPGKLEDILEGWSKFKE